MTKFTIIALNLVKNNNKKKNQIFLMGFVAKCGEKLLFILACSTLESAPILVEVCALLRGKLIIQLTGNKVINSFNKVINHWPSFQLCRNAVFFITCDSRFNILGFGSYLQIL